MQKGNEQEGFGIEQLFGSKTRSRLLQLFLKQPDEKYFVRELTRKIDAQLNSVRRELNNLVELGVVEVTGSDSKEEKTDRKKYYQVNKHFTLFDELRSLFTKASILIQQDLVKSVIEGQPVQALILSGSFVGTTESETDMLIVGSPEPKSLQERIVAFETALGREINYTVMATDEYLYRKDISDRFLASILDNDNVVIHNTL
ncbi:winged helix-turn-helix transcriptional regulator [Candidatus Uhrbacteria bacterium]|jgi:predicted transcriptional regulator|nr:winged helix-turn-helix transcriptional regulator [Candidatus Uhrbacteria bacterium]